MLRRFMLIKLASQYTAEKQLYVVAIGAITNVASALLIEPSPIPEYDHHYAFNSC